MFPIWNAPPTSLPIPSLWLIPVHQPQAPCIMHRTWTSDSFHNDIIHVSMPFSQIIPPSPSPTESKRLFYTSVSLLLSHIQGYRYHLSILPPDPLAIGHFSSLTFTNILAKLSSFTSQTQLFFPLLPPSLPTTSSNISKR